MLNMNALTQVADNEIRINNVVVGRLTDEDATKLLGIIRGMMGTQDTQVAHEVSAPTSGLVFEEDVQAQAKAQAKQIAPAQDYEVVLEGKDNMVWFACNAKDARQAVNTQLKAAGFTYDKDAERPDTYKRDYTRDGVTHKAGEHKHGAWVLMNGTKRNLSGAKAWIGKTITVTAAERQSIRDGWEARKAKRAER